jgi:hypothetical protein
MRAVPARAPGRRGEEGATPRADRRRDLQVHRADVPCDPGDIRLLRLPRLVREANGLTPMVEPCRGTWFPRLSLCEVMS